MANGNSGPPITKKQAQSLVRQYVQFIQSGGSHADAIKSLKAVTNGQLGSYSDAYTLAFGKPPGPQPGGPPSTTGKALGTLEGLGVGAAEGLTLGHTGQINAALGPNRPLPTTEQIRQQGVRSPGLTPIPAGRIPGSDEPSPGALTPEQRATLERNRASTEDAISRVRREHPGAVRLGEAVGGSVPFGALAAAGPFGMTGNLALAGGLTGAATGEDRSPAQRAAQAAGGAATGFLFGAAGRHLEALYMSDQALNTAVAENLAKYTLPSVAETATENGLVAPKFERGSVKVEPFFESLKRQRQAVGKAAYDPIDKTGPVESEAITKYLSGEGADVQQASVRTQAVNEVMGEEAGKRPPTPRELRHIRRRLRSLGEKEARSGDSDQAKTYRDAASGLDALMKEKIPGQAAADLEYRVAKLREDAPEAARQAYGYGSKTQRPEQIAKAREEATTFTNADGRKVVDPVASAAWRSEAIASEVDRLGKKGGWPVTRSQWKRLTADVNEDRIRAGLFPKGEAGDKAFAELQKKIARGERIYLTGKQRRRLKYIIIRPILAGLVIGGMGHIGGHAAAAGGE